MLKSFTENRDFLSKLIIIAFPIIIQNLISSSLNFLDVFMIGQLGEKEVAAVGIGNQIYFLFLIFVFSIAGGTAVFTAQYWGKRNIGNIHSAMGMGLTLSLMISFIFTLLILLFPEQLIYLYNTDEGVVNSGKQYIIIIVFSFNIIAITMVYSVVLRTTEHTILPMIASIMGLATNTVLNYLLIYGKFGFPELKVRGAAIATIIARCLEFSLLLIISIIRKHPTIAPFKEIFYYTKDMLISYLKRAAPVVAQSMGWALGYNMYAVIYGHINYSSLASYNIAGSVEKICLIIFSSLGSACAIMVGNKIGAEEYDKAREYSKKFIFISLVLSILLSIILYSSGKTIVGFYKLSDEGSVYLYYLLLVMSLIMSARAMNIIFQMGILKGGGDTIYGMIVDMGGIWFIGVPIAAIAAFVFGLPVYYVMALAAIEEFVKMGAVFIRFFSNKWIHNLTIK